MKSDPDLHRLDPGSSTWKTVKLWCEVELTILREQNDNFTLPENKTAVIRGKIEMLKEILRLTDPKPTISQEPVTEDDIF